ncbi:rRNA pseudouridine synthase [Phaeovibrio sulfidiphilus]|uniref:Pseudouridine synthase n=1 Tax=Phaeovibrio sulfidiphilus TaxID=1220600 RepID=A0A8J6YR61_9PROT|nr:pseudouridine synthase [Phaeovibrio sulfidiphilus]MBE1237897.1 rRNA pseudouridine synthase [Phaeovibrio sulfidiphilus]
MSTPEKERIAKVIARAGVCSRREAETLISEGRVVLNGKPLSTPATLVGPKDQILVNGKPLPDKAPTRLWRYHKPAGVLTSNKDPEGRPTLFERLPADMPRVVKVGRLDLDSEGLLLLTNDGALAHDLERPSQGWLRRYRVRVFGTPDPVRLAALEDGITIEGERFGPIRAVLERQQASNAWLSVSLREGKNREIRRVMEHLGLPVSRLIRVAYGPFQLGHLAPGQVEEVPGKILREQLGKSAPPRPERPRTRHPAKRAPSA